MDQEFEMLSIDQVKEVETESAFIQEKVENIESLSTNVGEPLTLDKFDEDVLQNDSNLQLHEEQNQMPIQHLDSDCDGSIKDKITETEPAQTSDKDNIEMTDIQEQEFECENLNQEGKPY